MRTAVPRGVAIWPVISDFAAPSVNWPGEHGFAGGRIWHVATAAVVRYLRVVSDPEPPGHSAAEDRVARARMRRVGVADVGDIAPKLPRGSGFKMSKGHFFKIVLTASFLVMLVVIQRPCANAVSGFVTSFDEGSPADQQKMPKPGNVDGSGATQFETLRGDLTEDEWKAIVERAKLRNGQGGGTNATDPNLGSNAAGTTPASIGAGSNAAGSNAASSNATSSNAAGSNAAGSNAAGSNAAGSNSASSGATGSGR